MFSNMEDLFFNSQISNIQKLFIADLHNIVSNNDTNTVDNVI